MILDSAKKFWSFIAGLVVVGYAYLFGCHKLIERILRRKFK
jgi:hypothetical protein